MGVIPIYRDCASDATAISNIFIDEYMKDANDAQIKVYLYLVRMMSSNLPTSIAIMADLFNHTEKEILRSLRYWEQRGVLRLHADQEGNLVSIQLYDPLPSAASQANQVISIVPALSAFRSEPRDTAAESSVRPSAKADPPAKTDPSVQAPSSCRSVSPPAGAEPSQSSAEKPSAGPRFCPEEISQDQLNAFQSSEHGCQLLLIAEQYIGKPLSPYEAKSVCCLSETLHFSDELIDYLIEYCVGLGKRDFHYIGKVAMNWSSQGVTTAAQAQAASSRQKKRSSRKASRRTGFCQFEQNSYDFDTLEQQLLNS